GSPIRSAISLLVDFIAFLFFPSTLSRVEALGDRSTASRNCPAICRLLLFITELTPLRLSTLEQKAISRLVGDSPIRLGDLQDFISSFFSAALFLFANKTQVQQFKNDVSNSTTQDSIMNVHNKTQLTYARINYILKDSTCDIPLSKILKLTILASNEILESNATLILIKKNTMHAFTHRFARIFHSTTILAHSRSKKVFSRLVIGLKLTFSFWAQHTGTKGDLRANQRLANRARRSSGLHFFVLFSYLVPFCQVVSMLCLKLQIPET
ncbi:hypothetical protein H5410_014846, partial [Solanum commersonii]